jgi:FkbM family methyltransferase
MDRVDGTIVCCEIFGKDIRFFVTDKDDVIQKQHWNGKFYESEELMMISKYFSPGGVFVDIGSNVGNHLTYIAKYCAPSQIIPFEPNPPAIKILLANIYLNNLSDIVDAGNLGVGLSNKVARAEAKIAEHNLGGTRLRITSDEGGLRLIRGDDALVGRKISFLKIDVEGMEKEVLEGLQNTIRDWRPFIFVEIDDRNKEYFDNWVQENRYNVVGTFKRHEGNENYMIIPTEKSEDDQSFV